MSWKTNIRETLSVSSTNVSFSQSTKLLLLPKTSPYKTNFWGIHRFSFLILINWIIEIKNLFIGDTQFNAIGFDELKKLKVFFFIIYILVYSWLMRAVESQRLKTARYNISHDQFYTNVNFTLVTAFLWQSNHLWYVSYWTTYMYIFKWPAYKLFWIATLLLNDIHSFFLPV